MLSEDEIRRIAKMPVSDPTANRWLQLLLADRRHLVAMIQGLARQVHHLRARMKQASTYLDGLAERVEETSRAPWPRQVPCPRCGAAVERLSVDYRPEQGHALVRQHADGTACVDKPGTQQGNEIK